MTTRAALWVLMFSGSPWAAAAHRQHALARELAVEHRVVFVDPPENRRRSGFSVHQVAPSLWHATLPCAAPYGRQLPAANRLVRRVGTAPLRAWLDDRPGPRLLWLDEDLAEPVVGRLGETAVVYDATDLDWTFTRRWNRWHLRRALHRAVAAADLVLASSAALPARLPRSRRPAVVLANACDPQHFQPEGPVVAWLARLPRPVVGYLGAVDTRALDGELVATVAHDHPEWTFVLVGPATAAGRRPFAGLHNVHLFGPVPYLTAPAVVRAFDVALVPYRVGGLIDYVHPKKLYEYLAAGRPVVATSMPALVGLDAPVRLADGPGPFARAIGEALQESDPARAAGRRAVALANSWQHRGALLRELVAGLGIVDQQPVVVP